jgi:hypothetical protein
MRKGFLIQYMRKCANISTYMRRPLVIYDFATAPSEFPYFFFISVSQRKNTERKRKIPKVFYDTKVHIV